MQVLESMDLDDTNACSTNIFKRYVNQPDCLEQMCSAVFSSYDYANKSMKTLAITLYLFHLLILWKSSIIITLKNVLGKIGKD